MPSYKNKWFHCLLIIMLILVPLRSVMAMQMSQCKMDESTSLSSATASKIYTNSTSVAEHINNHQHSDSIKQQCCCCDKEDCVKNCGAGLPVSLVIQQSIYTPQYVTVNNTTVFSPAIHNGVITPPSRPPQFIS